jgi:hypothetical protein
MAVTKVTLDSRHILKPRPVTMHPLKPYALCLQPSAQAIDIGSIMKQEHKTVLLLKFSFALKPETQTRQ